MVCHFDTSRDLFEAAREAYLDARRCQAQLDAMEARVLSVSGPSLDAHVGGGEHDRMGARVAAYVDREAELESRIDADFRLIDAANAILYGRDGMSDGLASLAPAWWADALYWHYLVAKSWPFVAKMVGYDVHHVQRCARAAFELMDENGMHNTVDGRGWAE